MLEGMMSLTYGGFVHLEQPVCRRFNLDRWKDMADRRLCEISDLDIDEYLRTQRRTQGLDPSSLGSDEIAFINIPDPGSIYSYELHISLNGPVDPASYDSVYDLRYVDVNSTISHLDIDENTRLIEDRMISCFDMDVQREIVKYLT